MPSENTEQRKLAAIMFTDMVGYSALSQRNEALALELLAENQRLLRTQFPLFNGREVKTTGDGFLVEFPSALQATQCAVEIQRAVAARNGAQPSERHIQVRIGIHVGDVVHREADMYGDGVNIAARIEPLAIGGGICLSDTVYAQVRNKVEVGLTKLDSPDLKHIEVPMDVYRVVLPWEKPRSSRREEAHSKHGAGSQSLVTSAATKRAAIAAFVLLAVGLGWWLFHQSGQATKQIANPQTNASPTAPAAASATDQKSIAVLPFVNMSSDKENEYLSDGITEEILNTLAKVPGLRVPARTSSFAFKDKKEDVHKIGELLHVGTVLEGSVRKAGNQLRITAQLINVADGFHLWSETYDRDMTNFFAIQSDIAARVATALKGQLGVEEARAMAKKPTENPEAHRLYLLGRYHFAKTTAAGWTSAAQYFNEALRLDPNYALAYCGLADNYGWMGLTMMSSKEAWAKEKELAQKALEMDPNLADAHAALGGALMNLLDFRGAENEGKRALELNPNLALAYDGFAWLRTCFGRFDEAFKLLKKAVELDPLSPMINGDLAVNLCLARRYDEAIAQARATLDLDPNYASAHNILGWCFLWKGDTAGAMAEFQKARMLDSQTWHSAALGYAYAVSGDRAKAEQVLHDLEALAKQRFVSAGDRVAVYLGLGEKDKALDWLEKSYEELAYPCQVLKVERLYDSVRNEPRFQALLKKVGFDK